MVSGSIQKAICLLLLDEGQMTVEQMHVRVDAHSSSLRGALDGMTQIGIATREKYCEIGSSSRVRYGLTKKGIEGALKIDPNALLELERKPA